MNRLTGKRGLITGGTTGIGLERARQFLKEGARVMVIGTNPATLDSAQKELGSDALIISSNAADVPAQKNLVSAAQKAFGTLDILVINAGIAEMRPLEQWDETAYDRSFFS
jgi:NADP-dependent 3-hydroxy acid dehydrogenase YdfG